MLGSRKKQHMNTVKLTKAGIKKEIGRIQRRMNGMDGGLATQSIRYKSRIVWEQSNIVK